jgi:hypothetical protein
LEGYHGQEEIARLCRSEGLIDLKKLLTSRSRGEEERMQRAPYMHLIRTPNAARKQRKSSDRRPPFHWTQLRQLAAGDRPMEGSAQLSVTQRRSPPNPSQAMYPPLLRSASPRLPLPITSLPLVGDLGSRPGVSDGVVRASSGRPSVAAAQGGRWRESDGRGGDPAACSRVPVLVPSRSDRSPSFALRRCPDPVINPLFKEVFSRIAGLARYRHFRWATCRNPRVFWHARMLS